VTRLPDIQGAFRQALETNADLLYRHTATWSDGTRCRFSVQDPNKADTALNRTLRERPDAPDLRLLKVHPADTRPTLAAHLTWEDGVLFVERYAQASDFTAQAVGVCRLVVPARIASYPLVFQGAAGLVQLPNGNTRPGPGQPIPVTVRLEATQDPQVRATVGADVLSVALYGRWGAPGQPQERPAGVQWGSSAPLTFQGVPGQLTLKAAFPDADPVITAIHGEPFLASWVAGKEHV
jgi:hypothetical protein